MNTKKGTPDKNELVAHSTNLDKATYWVRGRSKVRKDRLLHQLRQDLILLFFLVRRRRNPPIRLKMRPILEGNRAPVYTVPLGGIDVGIE
jgi:hypothetical protein